MAARKTPLRSVKPDEAPVSPPKKPKTVAQAAEGGNHRELLVAMRERIAKAVTATDCPPRDLAALTRRLQDISQEIEAIDLRAKEEGADAHDLADDEGWDSEAL